ncbi:nuclear transport factor 2 family protein [Neorhizobium sp. T786]|uniref:nuclear transport factor 2 family protein n=1 Tax=Pseudorhizobium xiangyangii TaxID=2883104 RepID=UPI001CFFD493|nr:nuclear transport factor 2 family protein [Neorhizobium xiangyangii]MCB5205485.1 nuclear transport factor 2 family protein [Neorhizobium xiangyangii]
MTETAIVDAFLGRVFSGETDKALELVHPQAKFISTRPTPNPTNPLHGTFVGLEGAKLFFGGFGALLEPGHFSVDARFAEGEHVALYGTLRHKSRATGRDFASDWALICKVQAGKIVLYHFYEDTEALALAIA